MCIRVLGQRGTTTLPTQTKPVQSRKKVAGESLLTKEFERFRILRIVAVASMLALATLILVGLFAPGLRYALVPPPDVPVDASAFLNELEPLVSSKITRNNQIEVIENGENFYKAELDAMRQARHSINIEAYIFHTGKLTDEVIAVLTASARRGVRVNLVIDALGSLSTRKKYFKALKEAGGKVEWYHRLRLHNWFITNNRTHREITIVDGSIAFVGGAGYADWWRFATKGEPRWRDTMVRAQGDAVRAIQGAFVENWLEASGEILSGADYFPVLNTVSGSVTGLVVCSTPSSSVGSTRARVLFQTLIAAARKSIYITTPYFLPDRSMRDELMRAKKRGVELNIIVPGKHDDHALTRSSGRSAYGDLLKAGANIYEYESSMIHAKVTVIDGIWSVVGSTNLDNRSFGINDEINLAVFDSQVAARLTHDFQEDTSHSQRVTLQQWKKRSVFERVLEWVGWILERQQ
jgi:cardiolipin synthase